MSLLEVRGLGAGYGRRQVLREVSFSLGAGELVGILGVNGCGKSTLLKSVCGILPHTGECLLDGVSLESLPPRRLARLCGYIPQRSGIEIDISAIDVVLMGFNPRMGLLEHPSREMRAAASAALEQVGLGDRGEDNYLSLSEGQKQLCILARTLVSQGRLLLLDEPESALDFHRRDYMLRLLQAWVREGERGALVALHDPSLALQYCDRLLLLDGGCVSGIISPATDSLSAMERALSALYGEVSLLACRDRGGRQRIVMWKE